MDSKAPLSSLVCVDIWHIISALLVLLIALSKHSALLVLLIAISKHFIWDNPTSQITQKTLLQKIEKRGLKLYHYPKKVDTLKLSWIKRLT